MAKAAVRKPARAAKAEAAADHSEASLIHRLMFFTDAVFAIAMTLLVLELRPPAATSLEEMVEGLREMGPHLTAFLMSFALGGIFWMSHMSTLRHMVRFDWLTAWVNLAFLAAVSLMPFASALMGAGGFGSLVWQIYSLEMIAASTLTLLLMLTLTRGGGRLIGGITPRERAYRAVRAASPGVAFAVGWLLARVDQMAWAHACWLLIPAIFAVARMTLGPKKGA